jgi:hypothetical protein
MDRILMEGLWQTLVIAIIVVGAVAYLAYHYIAGRKQKGSCPNCRVHDLPRNLTRHRPPNRRTTH